VSDGRDDTQARPVGGAKPSPDLFQKWSRAPYWGPEEGVALAFGLDPAKVVKNDASGYDHPHLNAPDPAPHFANLARRAVAKGNLKNDPSPSDFIDWAERVGLAFHDNWTSALNSRIPARPGSAPTPAPRFSAALAAPRLPGAPGAPNKGVVAAEIYLRVFPDGHELLGHSWNSAIADIITNHGAPKVSKRTLQRGLETLRQKEI